MNWALATIGLLLLAYAAVSRRVESLNISAAMFFTTAGLVAGPVLALLDVPVRSHDVKLLAEITLTLVLFADASRISLSTLRAEFAVPLRLLGIGLPLTIVAGTLAGIAIIPGVGVTEALVLGVMLASTDAALGQAVVTDERVPSRIRHGLNVESGLNDGICVPLFFIAIALAEADEGRASAHSAVNLVLEELGYGLVGGIVAGVLGASPCGWPRATARSSGTGADPDRRVRCSRQALQCSRRSIFIAHSSAASCSAQCGVRRGRGEQSRRGRRSAVRRGDVHRVRRGHPRSARRQHHLAGHALRGHQPHRRADGAGRANNARNGARRPTVAFLGWFGPRGLASIVFGVILLDESNLPHENTLLLTTVVTIALSVYAHGVTARPLTLRYVRWYESHAREERPAMESVPVAEQRWRTPIPRRL